MTVPEWLKKFPEASFRSSYFSMNESGRIDTVKFKVGDILCVPHGPYMYLFGIRIRARDGSPEDSVFLEPDVRPKDNT